MRYVDISGTAAINTITFVAADDNLINGTANIIINVNGASGIITPNLSNMTWELSATGSTSSSNSGYDVFGTISFSQGTINDNITSLNLIGLEKIYPENNAQSIVGFFTVIESVILPDLTEAYGDITFYEALNMSTFNAPKLTTVKGLLELGFANSLESLNISSLRTLSTVDTHHLLNTNIGLYVNSGLSY